MTTKTCDVCKKMKNLNEFFTGANKCKKCILTIKTPMPTPRDRSEQKQQVCNVPAAQPEGKMYTFNNLPPEQVGEARLMYDLINKLVMSIASLDARLKAMEDKLSWVPNEKPPQAIQDLLSGKSQNPMIKALLG